MIVKIHSRGAGSGSGPVDYLLGKDRQREQASVLRGNPEYVRELIDGCDFARAYTSGVLSFQEPDIADAEKSRLMDEWEHTLLHRPRPRPVRLPVGGAPRQGTA